MRKSNQPSKTKLAPARQPAGQLPNRDDQAVVRNLEFYREAEQQLFVKRNPYRGGGTQFSPWRAEW
jgi:hypothetical protein